MEPVVDPYAFIITQSRIPASQQQLLSITPFFRPGDISPAAVAADFSPAADGCGDDDTWPVTDDDDDDNVGNVEITFSSVPSSPDNQDDVVPSHSDEFLVNTTTQLNSVVSGNSGELESSVTVPVSVEEPRFSDLNGVVCGSSEELGFGSETKRAREEGFVTPSPSAVMPSFCGVNDVVLADSDLLGFTVERGRAREEKKLRFRGDVGNTMSVMNDVVCENTEGLGLKRCENSEGIQNDAVRVSSGDLGLRFSDNGDKIAVENTVVLVNDVVGEVSHELGLCAEEEGAKENSWVPPEVTDDVVSDNSIDLGFKRDIDTTTMEIVFPTTAEFHESIQNDVVSDKLVEVGERCVTNEEFTMPPLSTTQELLTPELGEAEMEVEIENTAKIDCDTEEVTVINDCKGKELDTEEMEEAKEDDVVSDNTEEFDTSDSEGSNDNENGDTEEVTKEDKLNNSTMVGDLDTEICKNHVICLMEIMKTLAERSRKNKEEGGHTGKVDFLETAKRRGYKFPKPRWMSS